MTNQKSTSANEPLSSNDSGCQDTSCCPPKAAPIKRHSPKVGRNDPCPCGSERKHKKCCGK